jgi:hypothetical protein
MPGTRIRPSRKFAVIGVTSSAFPDGGTIPVRYTGDGDNLSPALSWSTLPEGTASIAILCEDPDAPGTEAFSHWVAFNLPPSLTGLPERVARSANPPELRGGAHGVNHFGGVGYDGPKPPRGDGPHRYQFQVYALDEKLSLPPGASAQALRKVTKGHILGKGVLVGLFSR